MSKSLYLNAGDKYEVMDRIRTFLILGFTIIAVQVSAQLILSDTSVAVINGEIDLVESSFEITGIDVASTAANRLDVSQIAVSVYEGEIVVEYAIADPQGKIRNQDGAEAYNLKGEQENHRFHLNVGIRYEGKYLFVRPDMMIGDIYNRVNGAGKRTFIVTGIPDRYVQLDGQMEIYLTLTTEYDLNRRVSCDEEPQYGFAQYAPYMSIGIVGLGIIGGGIAMDAGAKDQYELYREQTDPDVAERLYVDATNRRNNAEVVMYVGAGVLVVDAILLILDRKKYKRDLYLYRKYCPEGIIELRPHVEMPDPYASVGNMGLKVAYTFR